MNSRSPTPKAPRTPRTHPWAGVAFALLVALCPAGETRAGGGPTPPEFTVAFIGDQGAGADAQAVLELIAAEGADAVVHGGDLDYGDDPAAWDALVTSVLGTDFPYFVSAGNHDKAAWSGYQAVLEARMNAAGIPWTGDLGVSSTHDYAGIRFVLVAPDIFANNDGDAVHAPYLRDRLAESDAVWRIASWHKNMNAMQVGGKGDDTGWGVYEESRRGGAVVATGHEHSYSRTHLMSSFELQTIASTASPLVLEADDPGTPSADEGRSFVFVSGLGGRSIRDQHRSDPWWASIYTSDQNANFGALFGTFHHQGDPRLARFTFKSIDPGYPIIDQFLVESQVGTLPPQPLPDLHLAVRVALGLLLLLAGAARLGLLRPR